VAEGVHILLVQDEDRMRHSYRVNLELDGFRVSEAADGAQALRQARQERPDLVVLDLMLPVMDGWEALGELKTDQSLWEIPVVILTRSAAECDELRALERGALAFVAKPVGVEDLIAVIRRVLAGSSARSRSGGAPTGPHGPK